MNGIYLLLGSNLGDRLANLQLAEELLVKAGIKVLNESSIYETEPWGKKDQPWFLNVILQIETKLLPSQLLQTCSDIEINMGRKRVEKWGERKIDIDILYYYDEVMKSDELTIPHPAIEDRRFTLMPMCELAPNTKHPISDLRQNELLANCKDELDCKLTDFQL